MPDSPGMLENFLSINPAFASYYDNQRALADQEKLQQSAASGAPVDLSQFNNPVAGAQGQLALTQFKNIQQQQAALPAQQRLADFATTGKPLEEMGFQKLNQLPDGGMGGLPSDFSLKPFTPQEEANPYVKKSIEDFKVKQGNTALTADVLKNPTPENVARLIQTNPEHFASNMKNASAMLPSVDTETPKASSFMQDAMFVAERAPSIEDFTSGMQSVLEAHPDVSTKTVQDFVKETTAQVKEKLKPEKAETRPAPHAMHLAGGFVQDMRFNPATGKDEPYGVKYKPTAQQSLEIKQTQNAMPPEHAGALDAAISSGRLDPYKVNSRNRQDLARLAYNNPGVDINTLAAQAGIARNKDVIMKAGVAEMIPDLLKKTVETGKKLKYSDVQFVGAVQRWRNGQLNDPVLTKYMTLRNDQLLTIGGVMRQNGMTDMAQRLEEEAAKPTMSPRALDGWLEGQLESIDPRLNFYRSLTGKNKAIPRSSYTPGTGIKGLNATGGPAVGMVKSGYRFKGGNPSDKNSWVKVGG